MAQGKTIALCLNDAQLDQYCWVHSTATLLALAQRKTNIFLELTLDLMWSVALAWTIYFTANRILIGIQDPFEAKWS